MHKKEYLYYMCIPLFILSISCMYFRSLISRPTLLSASLLDFSYLLNLLQVTVPFHNGALVTSFVLQKRVIEPFTRGDWLSGTVTTAATATADDYYHTIDTIDDISYSIPQRITLSYSVRRAFQTPI